MNPNAHQQGMDNMAYSYNGDTTQRLKGNKLLITHSIVVSYKYYPLHKKPVRSECINFHSYEAQK